MKRTAMLHYVLRTTLVVVAALDLGACYANGGGVDGKGADASTSEQSNPGSTVIPFAPLTARDYTNKVKNLLTGIPATDAEIQQVTASPAALKGLIAQWQTLPQYNPKMITFLSNAFQQSEVDATDFVSMGVAIDTGALGTTTSNLLVSNLQQSFAQTILAREAASQPFNEAMSTQTFMMTAPLATYYAYLDNVMVDDQGKMTNNNQGSLQNALKNYTASDFTSWHSVTISQPPQGQATTSVANAGTATQMYLNTPRQGFYSTLAFFAGWQTNLSNQARVTMNQTLITALGHAFDGTESIMPQSEAALDSNHAAPGSSCFACHMDLDPMRQFFRQAYTIGFSPQNSSSESSMPGMFAFDGVSAASTSIYDLGKNLASHPSLAAAWVQKLCTYADDAPCDTTDPEFQRVTAVFASKFSWNDLVQELFSSPLVTYASATQTATKNGQSFPVSKRDHICPMWSNRLGVNDVCGLDPNTTVKGAMKTVQLIASILPANGYSRGQVLPVLANDPSLFYRSGVENICATLSQQMVTTTSTTYPANDPNTTISNLVHNLMGVSASNDSAPINLLQSHYQAAMQQSGITATNALQSTFVAACLSPGVVGIGQ